VPRTHIDQRCEEQGFKRHPGRVTDQQTLPSPPDRWRLVELPSTLVWRYRRRGKGTPPLTLEPRTELDSRKALSTLFRWPSAKKYTIDADVHSP